MGHVKIENSIAQQGNYDDLARAHGWNETIYPLDENGNMIPLLDEKNEPVIIDGALQYQTEPQSSQQFLTLMYKRYSDELAITACRWQELQQGKLNYDAERMIALFKATTKVTWEE